MKPRQGAPEPSGGALETLIGRTKGSRPPDNVRLARFLVAGSLNMDLAFDVPHLPRAGEAVHADRLRRDLGGKGFNQAVAIRRLGAEVAMVGAVGEDAFGYQFLDRLGELGINRDGVRQIAGAATGTAVPVVDRAGANFIVVAMGANLDPSVGEIPEALWAGIDILLLQGELAPEVTLRLAAGARTRGVPFLLNLAPADPRLEPAVAGAAVVVVNEVEAADLVGAARLLKLGAGSVVVTLGPAGAEIHVSGEVARVTSPRLQAVDSTGAGDAFCAALAVQLAANTPLPEAVRWACAAGAAACLKPGTSGSMPDRAEVEALLH